MSDLSENVAISIFIRARWPHGMACDVCGSDIIYKFQCRRLFKCGVCGDQFTITSNTILKSRKLPLKKICLLLNLMTKDQPPSILEMSRQLRINYRGLHPLVKKIRAVLAAYAPTSSAEEALRLCMMRPTRDKRNPDPWLKARGELYKVKRHLKCQRPSRSLNEGSERRKILPT